MRQPKKYGPVTDHAPKKYEVSTVSNVQFSFDAGRYEREREFICFYEDNSTEKIMIFPIANIVCIRIRKTTQES
jgi:hypothetical protein